MRFKCLNLFEIMPQQILPVKELRAKNGRNTGVCYVNLCIEFLQNPHPVPFLIYYRSKSLLFSEKLLEWRWEWPMCGVKRRHSNKNVRENSSTLLCLIIFPISSNIHWLAPLVTLRPYTFQRWCLNVSHCSRKRVLYLPPQNQVLLYLIWFISVHFVLSFLILHLK